MKKVTFLFVFAAFVLAACSRPNVLNTTTLIDNAAPERIEAAILAACADEGWKCTKTSDGLVVGVLIDDRCRRADVNIYFTQNSYNIIYDGSIRMEYSERGQTINKKYNNWVSSLDKAIFNKLNK